MKTHQITSIDNEKIKYLKKLNTKKIRDKSGQFLVENLRIIHDSMKSGHTPASLFVTKEMKLANNERVRYILGNINECFVITPQVNKFFSSLTTPSGICAVFDRHEEEIDMKERIIYLNNISDPGNLGTILRTALAFGFENIVVDSDCADIYNAKTISAAKDAIFKIKISHDKNLEILNKIKKKMKVYATNIKEGSEIKKHKKEKKFCIVFGNEANGVDEEILKKADGFIKINMSKKIESLNVAISAGIIFYEIYKGLSPNKHVRNY